MRGEMLERGAALIERRIDERLAARIDEQIENHVDGGMRPRERLHAACSGMNAHQQFIERRRVAFGYDELAIENAARDGQCLQRGDNLGEIALEWLARFRSQMDIGAVPKRQTTEAVPFRLVSPLRSLRQGVDRLRFHRRIVEGNGKRHQATCASSGARSNLPRFASTGAHRSPRAAIRAGTLSMRKSSIAAPSA